MTHSVLDLDSGTACKSLVKNQSQGVRSTLFTGVIHKKVAPTDLKKVGR